MTHRKFLRPNLWCLRNRPVQPFPLLHRNRREHFRPVYPEVFRRQVLAPVRHRAFRAEFRHREPVPVRRPAFRVEFFHWESDPVHRRCFSQNFLPYLPQYFHRRFPWLLFFRKQENEIEVRIVVYCFARIYIIYSKI